MQLESGRKNSGDIGSQGKMDHYVAIHLLAVAAIHGESWIGVFTEVGASIMTSQAVP